MNDTTKILDPTKVEDSFFILCLAVAILFSLLMWILQLIKSRKSFELLLRQQLSTAVTITILSSWAFMLIAALTLSQNIGEIRLVRLLLTSELLTQLALLLIVSSGFVRNLCGRIFILSALLAYSTMALLSLWVTASESWLNSRLGVASFFTIILLLAAIVKALRVRSAVRVIHATIGGALCLFLGFLLICLLFLLIKETETLMIFPGAVDGFQKAKIISDLLTVFFIQLYQLFGDLKEEGFVSGFEIVSDVEEKGLTVTPK